ncbi:hypothetical protein MASR2M18_09500 [Ignavibacteria bacterium]|nr:hypothetical protein [Bacteroidota bacterium]MCZ2133314.1 hypothetical protein [Bacteroidota bacterium]
MFEQYIEDQKKRLQGCIELTAASHNGFTSASLLSESPLIPDAYRRYFAAEIKRRTREMCSELLKNPHFLITETSSVFIEQFEKTLQNTAIFSDAELAQITDDAVKTRLNYLCRPRIALKWFVFGENKELNAEEICMRLNYLYDYEYLIEGVRKIIGDCTRPADKMLLEDVLVQAVESIDNDYIFDLTPRQFVDILAPLFDFFSPDSSLGTEKSMPTEALVVFLDDKHVEPIAQEMERLYHDENCTEITESIFLKIVTDILDTIDEFEAENKTVNTVGTLSEINTEIVKNTDIQSDGISGGFIAAPGEFAAVLAAKEFIAPEFIEKEKPKIFTVKFAPEPARSFVEALDEPDAAVISPDELKESLIEIEHIAKEAAETFDKVTEIIEAIDEHLTQEYSDDCKNNAACNANSDAENCTDEARLSEEQPRCDEVTTDEKYTVCDVEDTEIYIENNADIIDADFIDNIEDIQPENIENNYLSEELPHFDKAEAEHDISVPEADALIDDNIENYENIASEIIDADEVVALMLESEKLSENGKNIEYSMFNIITHDEIINENDNSTSADTSNLDKKINTEQFEPFNESAVAQATHYPKFSAILGDKRERYIKKLFEKDESVFQQLVDEIDASPSWKAAAQIYDNFLIDRAIPLDNSLAIEFRNMIKSRYAA